MNEAAPHSRSSRSRLSLVAALLVALAAPMAGPGLLAAAPRAVSAVEGKEAARLEAEVERLFGAGKYKDALVLAEQRVALFAKAVGKDHPETADAEGDVAALLDMMGEPAKSEELYLRAIGVLEKAFGPDHPRLSTVLANYAELLRKRGAYARAEPLFRRALAAQEKEFGPESRKITTTLNNLARLHQALGDHARAEPLYLRALAIREKTLGPEAGDTATTLFDLATLYADQSDFARAEPLHRRALAIAEKAYGPDHPSMGPFVGGLALMYKLEGELDLAEPLYLRSLALQEKASGLESPRLSVPLTNLASLYRARGDYGRAQALLDRALGIDEKALGPDHKNTIEVVAALGLLQRARGDDQAALPLLTRALAAREKLFGPDHPAVADSRNNLALLHAAAGRFDLAEPLFESALATYERAYGASHPKVSTALGNLASLLSAKGEDARAAALHQRGIEAAEKTLGADHPHLALALQNFGVFSATRGDFDRAEASFARALAIDEKVFGEKNPHSALVLANIAASRVARGDARGALEALTRSTEMRDRHAALVLGAGSEEQRRLFMNRLREETAQVLGLQAASPELGVPMARLAARTILRRKGRVLDAAAGSVAALRERLDPGDRLLLDDLSRVRSALASRAFGGAGPEPPAERRAAVGKLEEEMRALEATISQRSAAFRAAEPSVDLGQVQAALPAGAALIELLLYRPFDLKRSAEERWGKARYAAFVLHPRGEPGFVDLGEAALIDAGANELRAALASPEGDPRPAARRLDERVFQPLRALLGEARELFLSPDGALNLVPFAALMGPDGEPRVKRFLFTYLTSGRDLLRRAHERSEGGATLSSVVIANPDFGLRPTAEKKEGEASRAGAPLDRAAQLRRISFPPLPGTAAEGSAIHDKLGRGSLWSGALATEAELKRVHRPRILHLATHGFFLPAARSLDAPGTRGLALAEPSGGPLDAEPLNAPLLRSGLAFASANARPSTGDDGLLTALEASALDLHGTELVVLSACETGLGEARDGEGVYGLRRALILAGAETEVMSLWKVSDAGTRQLMIAYYDRLLAGGGRSASLRDVQLAMLAEPAHAHPFYWASFVVSGNSEPLRGITPSALPGQLPPGAGGCACAIEALSSTRAAPPSSAWVILCATLSLAASRRRRRATSSPST